MLTYLTETTSRLRNQPGGGLWLERAVQGGAILISLGFVLRSLVIIHDNIMTATAHDQWNLIAAMADDFRSVFSPAYLFSHQNEHIIATSHVVFMLDYFLFDLRSILPVTLTVILQLAMACLIGWVGYGDRSKQWTSTLAALFAVGTLSIAQWQNLVWGYQVQFPFFLFFGILAVLATDRFSVERISRRKAVAWTVVVFCMGLCVVSFAAGLLIGLPLIFMLIVARAKTSDVLAIGLAYVVLAASFFIGYQPSSAASERSIAGLTAFFLALIGSPISSELETASIFGVLGFGLFGVPLVRDILMPYLRGGTPDRRSIMLAAICFYALGFAAVTTWGRLPLGLRFATSSRYSTPAFLFWIGLIALIVRLGSSYARNGSERRVFLAATALMVLGFFGYSTLRPDAYAAMRFMVLSNEQAAFFLLSDVPSHRAFRMMFYVDADKVRYYPFLRAHRLSLFSPAARWYVPPDLTGDPLQAPACPRWWIEQVEKVAPGGWAVRGWAVDREGDANPDWILAFDRAGRRVGFTRSLLPRSELKAALHLKGEGFGFYLPIKLADGQVPNRELVLIAADENAPDRACRLAGAFSIPGK